MGATSFRGVPDVLCNRMHGLAPNRRLFQRAAFAIKPDPDALNSLLFRKDTQRALMFPTS
jgi:hypothetical protein